MHGAARRVSAVVVSVGNELLYGETVDTNAAWLGRALARMGIPVARRYTVADDGTEIRDAVAAGMAAAELVVVSGGLGPTSDDVTRPAVAGLLDRSLLLDEGLLETLRARFRARGYDELPAPHRSQAEVPEGARVLRNPNGTAPGLALETEGSLVVLLPGVPRELRGIFDGDLAQLIDERFGARLRPVRHRVLRTTGLPESRMAELVAGVLLVGGEPVSVAFLPDLLGVDLRLTAHDLDDAETAAAFDGLEARLRPILEPWLFSAPSGDLVEAVSEALLVRSLRLAVAESCTGGLVAKRVTDRAGSSHVFAGGVVAYDNEVKVRELGVDPADVTREGAVSEVVALQMAAGVARRFEVGAGIGVTGVAGPGGGTEAKPVGTVWIAASVGEVGVARLHRFAGDRHAVRERAAQAALHLLLGVVEGRPRP